MVWLAGGPATIDMWDLKPEAPETIRGEFKQIDTNVEGVQISEHLPLMAKQMDKATLVRSLFHTIPNHGPGTVWMTTGNKPTPAVQHPALGSLATKLMQTEKGVPPYVSFNELRNGSAGARRAFSARRTIRSSSKARPATARARAQPAPCASAASRCRPASPWKSWKIATNCCAASTATSSALDKSSDLADGLDTFHKQALEILRSDKTKTAFDLEKESKELRDRYGATPFGQGALAARRLVQSGVRFVTISLGGFDTHQNNFPSLKTNLLPKVDQTLSALIEDLHTQGMLDNTLVYCAGEFGRTPKINNRGGNGGGRDHWARSMAVVLAGGGIKRGYVHGSTDKEGMAPATEPCTPDDVASTIFHCLGLDPHHELQTPTGRPIQLFREGKAIEKLLA